MDGNRIDKNKLTLAVACISVVKNVIGLGVLLYILSNEKILSVLTGSEDELLSIFAGGMKAMLIVFVIIMAASTVQSILTLVVMLRGEEETAFGRRMIGISVAIRSSASYVFMAIMGVLFACMGAMSILLPDEMKDGDPRVFMIVGGAFVLIGFLLVLAAVINIVKEIAAAIRGGEESV